MKLVRAVVLFSLTVPVSMFAQTSWCNKASRADVVRVVLINCGKQDEINLRQDGNDETLIKLKPTAASGIWEEKWPGGAIESNVLCSTVCHFASDCKRGKPKPETKDGNDVCVAEYEFRCEEPAWTLSVRSTPLVTVDWTRKRGEIQQRGALRAAPGKLCDLADDEEVKLKPKLPPKSQFSFRDIPVTHDDLQRQKLNTLTLGPNDLVSYVVAPEGRRRPPLSDYEKEFLKKDLRELVMMIDPEPKQP